MSNEPETVLGEIPATAKLSLGTERLKLVVTSTRIIVLHIGKRGAGALATTSLFGRLSAAFEDFFKGSRESLEKRKVEKLGPGELLAFDKDNFAIGYEEIVSVEVDEMPFSTKITILTRDDKYQLFTRYGTGQIAGLLARELGGRVKTGSL